jgi:hypothetical protein
LWRFNENPAAPVLHGEHIPVSAGLIKGNDRPEVDLLMRRSLRRRKPLNCSNCGQNLRFLAKAKRGAKDKRKRGQAAA